MCRHLAIILSLITRYYHTEQRRIKIDIYNIYNTFDSWKLLAIASGHDPSTWHGSSPLLEQHWGFVQSGAPGTLQFALVYFGFILPALHLLDFT